MPRQHPTCDICGHRLIKNGTTSAGKVRWRCTRCGASTTRRRPDLEQQAFFNHFIDWITGKHSLTEVAESFGVSSRTMTNRFSQFWPIQPPQPVDPARIYDEIFIDGTYTNNHCLLIASTRHHILCWHWCTQETTKDYRILLGKLQPPSIVCTDGGSGARSAIKTCWPATRTQRCLVHIQRNVRTYVTMRPKTTAGKALRRLSLALTKIHTLDQAATWVAQLQAIGTEFGDWLNEKTYLKDTRPEDVPRHLAGNKQWWYTHDRARKAYNLMANEYRKNTLFTYLNPPEAVVDPKNLASTTNSLEGGFNSPLKNLIYHHRGISGEHLRIMVDWWLYQHTQCPDDPVKIARAQHFGTYAYQAAAELIAEESPEPTDGRPDVYGTGIESTPTNSQGIRRGPIR